MRSDSSEPRLKKIASDVYATIWSADDSVFGGYGANQAFAVLEDSVLVFDTGLSLTQAQYLDDSIRKVTSKKVRYLVNSHDHSDHVFGNSFFETKYSKSGLWIISHENCRERLRTDGTKRMRGYRNIRGFAKFLGNLKVLLPEITYLDTGFKLEIEGTQFVFVHPPTGAHTLGDTLACIPKKGIMFAGDVIWNAFLPNLEDANLEGWVEALEEIDFATYKKCVPGHGDICGEKEMRGFTNYLKEVRSRIASLGSNRTAHMNENDLRSCFEFIGTEDWKFRMIVQHNVRALFHN